MKQHLRLSSAVIALVAALPLHAVDHAVHLSSLNAYIELAGASDLDINFTNAPGLTIEMWIKPDPNPTGYTTLYNRRIQGTGGISIDFWIDQFRLFVASGNTSLNIETDPVIRPGVWQHVAFQVDAASRTAMLYLNGRVIARSTSAFMPAPASLVATLGNPNNTFKCTVDELRISSVARYGSSFTPSLEPLTPDVATVALWHFDDGSGTAAADASGTLPPATLRNDVRWVAGFTFNTAPLPPDDPRCDGQTNPTSLLKAHPQLTWTFNDPDTNDAQSAYHILVSSDAAELAVNLGGMWDSDKVESHTGSALYTGKMLHTGVTYYWKVRTWDVRGATGPFCAPQTFVLRSAVISPTTAQFAYPIGVNSWNWPLTLCTWYASAGISRYRVMIDWSKTELTDVIPPDIGGYAWGDNFASAVRNAAVLGHKVQLCIYDSPGWARTIPNKNISARPEKYAEFVLAALRHADSIAPGVVDAVEIFNENLSNGSFGEPGDPPVTHGTDQRDPSWYYATILKYMYPIIKQYNPNLLVVTDGILSGPHYLDELYQTGCKGYFDRVTVHYYSPRDAMSMNSEMHFPSYLRYLKYLAEQNGDSDRLFWITEFGLATWDEQARANHFVNIMDTCRKSGFVDRINFYDGVTGGWPDFTILSPGQLPMSLLYADEMLNPRIVVPTTSYYRVREYTTQFPTWGPDQSQPLTVIPPASTDAAVINPGFESGTLVGWDEVGAVDSTVRFSGRYSGRTQADGAIMTAPLVLERGRFYEVCFWVRIDAPDSDAACGFPFVLEKHQGNPNDVWFQPDKYDWGVVDTRHYPNRWRRIRFQYRAPDNLVSARVRMEIKGTGTMWLDNMSVKALRFDTPTVLTGTPPGAPQGLAADEGVRTVTRRHPTLSWLFDDVDGDSQSAYRIVVSTSLSEAQDGRGSWWDTGRTAGSAHSCTYAGLELLPGLTYYWRVQVWDSRGVESILSDISWFVSASPTGVTPASLSISRNRPHFTAHQNQPPLILITVHDASGAYVPDATGSVSVIQSGPGGTRTTSDTALVNGMTWHPCTVSSAGAVFLQASAAGLTGAQTSFHVLINAARETLCFNTDDAGRTWCIVPPHTLATDGLFTVQSVAETGVPHASGLRIIPGTVRRITISDPALGGTAVPVASFRNPVTLYYPYSDADGNGILDGTSYTLTDLRLVRYDEQVGAWRAVAGAVALTGERTFVAECPGFSYFALAREEAPQHTTMHQNYPNPFNPKSGPTTIRYELDRPATVSIHLYTLSGELVRTLVAEVRHETAGTYHVIWDGTNTAGTMVASGVFFCKFAADGMTQTRKIAVLRK